MTYAEIKSALSATEVKAGTAKAERLHDMFYRGDRAYALWQVYDHYSQAKYDAWEKCRLWCSMVYGKNFRICSHNTNVFTAGFIVEDNTGKQYLVYITPTYNYITQLMY